MAGFVVQSPHQSVSAAEQANDEQGLRQETEDARVVVELSMMRKEVNA